MTLFDPMKHEPPEEIAPEELVTVPIERIETTRRHLIERLGLSDTASWTDIQDEYEGLKSSLLPPRSDRLPSYAERETFHQNLLTALGIETEEQFRETADIILRAVTATQLGLSPGSSWFMIKRAIAQEHE